MLRALPAAHRILELGPSDSVLQACYRQTHPDCTWQSAHDRCADITGRYDLIVLHDGWQHLSAPGDLLRGLAEHCDAGGQLFLDMENQAQLAMVRRWLEGDLTDDDDGALAQPHLRYASAASMYKLLLDTGWMPTLVERTPAPSDDAEFEAATLTLAESLGIPRATAQRDLCAGHYIIQAQRSFGVHLGAADAARFTVVVPTTRHRQLQLNVECSPGLREVDAHVVPVSGARNPADAVELALPHVASDWVLLCHQDVYFPAGFGRRLNALLAGIAPEDAATTLIGFAGMGVNRQNHAYEPAGFVIDRQHRFDHAASDTALSIDELAIVVSRQSLHRIDPQMGWHLWATDLCLQAICTHGVFPRIVRLPLFHNSLNDFKLPREFFDSAAALLHKHPTFGPIPTLCATIDEQFLRHAPAR